MRQFEAKKQPKKTASTKTKKRAPSTNFVTPNMKKKKMQGHSTSSSVQPPEKGDRVKVLFGGIGHFAGTVLSTRIRRKSDVGAKAGGMLEFRVRFDEDGEKHWIDPCKNIWQRLDA